MRDIKFRAWDKRDNKTMYHGWTGKPQFFVNDGAWQITDKENLSVLHVLDRVEYLLPMQYTGLKDKNGVEIYEGDILRIVESTDNGFKDRHYDTNEEVKWSNEEGCWSLDYEPLYGLIERASVEVIGNIYENPELIEEK